LQERQRAGIAGLLGKIASWAMAISGNKGDGMSTNGATNGDPSSTKAEMVPGREALPAVMSPAEQEIAERKRMVAEAVEAADKKAREREQYEAGNDPRLNVPGLILGPQKYLDPDLWRPPYHLYPEGSRERQAFEEGHPVPLTQDQVLGRALDLVDRLERRHT
jgi:hypothetical protein